MNEHPALNLWERPTARHINMVVGWRQWADAGSISSALPEYLVELTGAKPIGEILADDFYFFQMPGTHHFLRPVIELTDGITQNLERPRTQIFYAGDEETGLLIVLGDEPHLHVERYTAALYTLAATFNVRYAATIGGVYGTIPHDKERYISCAYSLPSMKEVLDGYAVHYSNYTGGVTISSYLVARAAEQKQAWLALHALVPAYDFDDEGGAPRGLRIEDDYRAWYDILRRLNHLFQLSLNLNDLERQSEELGRGMDEQLAALEHDLPSFDLPSFLDQLHADFTELLFEPLDDVWTEGLDDLFKDL